MLTNIEQIRKNRQEYDRVRRQELKEFSHVTGEIKSHEDNFDSEDYAGDSRGILRTNNFIGEGCRWNRRRHAD